MNMYVPKLMPELGVRPCASRTYMARLAAKRRHDGTIPQLLS